MSVQPYYDDGAGIQIFLGDCCEAIPAIRRASVDLLLTDPPFIMPVQHYASRAESRWQRSWGDTSILARWWSTVVDTILPTLRDSGYLLVFSDDESYAVFYPALYSRFEHLAALVWDKGTAGMGVTWRHSHEFIIAARWHTSRWYGGHGHRDVLKHSSVPSASRAHPVDKPVPLLSELLASTTKPGDLVLDPFMGGGSTLLAAKLLGRRAIGVEIEERYCEIAANRLRQMVLPLEVTA